MLIVHHAHTIHTGMVQAAGQFFIQIETIGAKATGLPGAVRKLGESMMEMVEGQKDIASHQGDWVSHASRNLLLDTTYKYQKRIIPSHWSFR